MRDKNMRGINKKAEAFMDSAFLFIDAPKEIRAPDPLVCRALL